MIRLKCVQLHIRRDPDRSGFVVYIQSRISLRGREKGGKTHHPRRRAWRIRRTRFYFVGFAAHDPIELFDACDVPPSPPSWFGFLGSSAESTNVLPLHTVGTTLALSLRWKLGTSLLDPLCWLGDAEPLLTGQLVVSKKGFGTQQPTPAPMERRFLGFFSKAAQPRATYSAKSAFDRVPLRG